MLPLISQVYASPQTIFTLKDLALLWGETNTARLKDTVAYYAKKKHLVRLTRGIYAKNTEFNPLELGSSLYSPSYISFQTVFREAGIIFQHQDAISIAAPWSGTKKVAGYTFTLHKLKESILLNHDGIEYREHYSIATPERAFLDMIYLYPDYYFDNLRPINWEKCEELALLYQNKSLITRLHDYQKDYAESL